MTAKQEKEKEWRKKTVDWRKKAVRKRPDVRKRTEEENNKEKTRGRRLQWKDWRKKTA